MRSLSIALAFLSCALLVACAPQGATGNVVSVSLPVRTCSLAGFSCLAQADGTNDVTLDLTSQSDFSFSTAELTMVTGDCALKSSSVDLGYLPAGIETSVAFTCTDPIPSSFDAALSLAYSSENGQKGTATGAVSYRTPS